MPIPNPGGTTTPGTTQNESFYEGFIRQQFGAAAAAEYAALYSKLAAQFPPQPNQSTAYQIFNPFFAALAAGATVSAAAQAVSSGVAGVSNVTATSTLNLPFSGIFAGFFQANLWIRVGEVLLGLVLVAVGLARMTRAVPIATTVARKVGAVRLA